MDNQLQIHAPPPVGHAVYWAIPQNWRGPLLFGALFIVVIFLGLLPWVKWEMNNQRETHAAAIASIDTSRYHVSTNPRDSSLRRHDGLYHWTIVAWEKSPQNTWQAWLYTCTVDRRANPQIVSKKLEPYPQALENGERPPADSVLPASIPATPQP